MCCVCLYRIELQCMMLCYVGLVCMPSSPIELVLRCLCYMILARLAEHCLTLHGVVLYCVILSCASGFVLVCCVMLCCVVSCCIVYD